MVSYFVRCISRFFRILYSYYTKKKLKSCGKNFSVKYPFVLWGGENVSIGNNFTSLGFCYLYADNGLIKIGDNCSLNTNVQIGSSQEIIIGDNIMIGPNVVIRDANHGMSRSKIMRYQKHQSEKIIIENDVWIGANAVITPGVKLSQGTVVGAGAVVTKSTIPFDIVGGVPAKKISERI